jgi:hypothetical protein
MFVGKVYGKEIKSKSLTAVKRMASRIANGYWNAIDEMEVLHTKEDGSVTRTKWTRINKKRPNGSIAYGQWK